MVKNPDEEERFLRQQGLTHQGGRMLCQKKQARK